MSKIAIIYNSDIKNMKQNELENKYKDLCEELMAERSAKVTGGSPEKPGRSKAIRKAIARIKTRLNQMKLS